MKCQKCLSENVYCIDSREVDTNARRRRYKCIECEHRFSTMEVPIVGNSAKAIEDMQKLVEVAKHFRDTR